MWLQKICPPILRIMKNLPVFHDEYMDVVNDYCKFGGLIRVSYMSSETRLFE